MNEIFRPRKSDRIFPWVLSFISILLAVFIMVRLENLPAIGFVPIFFFPFFFLVIGILIGKSYIKVSDDGLSGRVMLMEFQIKWNEIIAGRAVHYESRPNNILFFLIKTSDKKITIPLGMFDGKPIWEAIKSKAPQAALNSDGYKNTEDYRKWEEGQNKLIEEQIRVGAHWFHKITPWTFLGLTAILTFIAWEGVKLYSLALGFMIWCGIVGMLGCFILIGLSRSYILADKENIRIFSIVNKYKIKWEEVERMEYTPDHSAVAFYGSNKRLVVLLEACSFSDRDKFVQKVAQHAKQKDIEPKQVKSLPRTQLNTRLPKGESF